MNTFLLKAILRTLAAKTLPAIEAQAIAWYLQHGTELKGKADLALEYGMKQYAEFTRNIPGLNASEVDDAIVRQQLKAALDWAWAHTDEQVKQAARSVTQAAPGTVTNPVTVKPGPPPGVPTTSADFGPSMAEVPPGEQK